MCKLPGLKKVGVFPSSRVVYQVLLHKNTWSYNISVFCVFQNQSSFVLLSCLPAAHVFVSRKVWDSHQPL